MPTVLLLEHCTLNFTSLGFLGHSSSTLQQRQILLRSTPSSHQTSCSMGDEASSLKPLRRSLQRLCPNVKPLSFNVATSLSAARTTCITVYLEPAAHRVHRRNSYVGTQNCSQQLGSSCMISGNFYALGTRHSLLTKCSKTAPSLLLSAVSLHFANLEKHIEAQPLRNGGYWHL